MTASRPLRARAIAAAALLAATGFAHAAAPAPLKLRLIGINDFHGNLEASTLTLNVNDPQGGKPMRVAVGGAAAVAGMVQQLRKGADHSLFVAAGDVVGASPLVSSLFKHESTIEIMNSIGLEVDAVGNHEFDAGIDELKRLGKGGCSKGGSGPAVSCALGPYTGAAFPLVSSNVLDAKGKPVLVPYVIKKYKGIRVGIIGGVTKDAPHLVSPSGVAGLTFIDEAEAVNRVARQLRAKGVRTMIAVFHEGGELGTPDARGDWNDATCPKKSGPIFDIAHRLVPEIKVVFSGHTHQGYRCEVEGRTIISGTSYGRGISVVDVQLDRRTGRMLPDRIQSINLPVVHEKTDPAMREKIAASLPEPYARVIRETKSDAAIADRVAKYAALAAPIAQRPIGTITATFTRGGRTDSAAGRLIADSQLAATRDAARGGAQLALMNPGGIRSDLECLGTAPCPVTFGQAFTMQPFGNSLIVMTFTGAQVKRVLESQQMNPASEPTMLQPSEGITYTWDSQRPIGDRVRDLKLNGEPIVPETNYRVTVNSFLSEGGDGFVLLKEGTNRLGGAQDLDALLEYLGGGTRSPGTEPRITRATAAAQAASSSPR